MVEIREIGMENQADIRLKNEPFSLYGKMIPSLSGGVWGYTEEHFPPEAVSEMCFPDENYDYASMKGDIFLGAYEGERCIGLAVLEPGFFKYIYLSDLKVNRAYRGKGIGRMLIEKAKEIALRENYCGVYTIGQDNNLAACLFYLHTGFVIGGFDTNVYRHTSQENKSDILFYCESRQG